MGYSAEELLAKGLATYERLRDERLQAEIQCQWFGVHDPIYFYGPNYKQGWHCSACERRIHTDDGNYDIYMKF